MNTIRTNPRLISFMKLRVQICRHLCLLPFGVCLETQKFTRPCILMVTCLHTHNSSFKFHVLRGRCEFNTLVQQTLTGTENITTFLLAQTRTLTAPGNTEQESIPNCPCFIKLIANCIISRKKRRGFLKVTFLNMT